MLKGQIAVLMQLQIALHDPSQGIRVLSGKNNGHFQKKKMYCHIGKVTQKNYRLSVYKGNVQRKSNVLYIKKVKQRCRTILKLEEKIRWSFSSYPTLLDRSTQTKN